ncbi:hypothetical protein GOBAR_AA32975 [Gossypium barbadense]|uniref:Uncharacterized protein n=1 Tax=Gossypium barbadense TaxID=3634 RepID=A0A2P5W9B6_GOSBA|nr:hypothetical protein GOBAR_AA32975 [Gossypium barbadense]
MPLTLQNLLVQNIGILSNHEPMLGGLNINYEGQFNEGCKGKSTYTIHPKRLAQGTKCRTAGVGGNNFPANTAPIPICNPPYSQLFKEDANLYWCSARLFPSSV